MTLTAGMLSREVNKAIAAFKANREDYYKDTLSQNYVWEVEAWDGKPPVIIVTCNISGVLEEVVRRMVARGHMMITERRAVDSVGFELNLDAQPL